MTNEVKQVYKHCMNILVTKVCIGVYNCIAVLKKLLIISIHVIHKSITWHNILLFTTPRDMESIDPKMSSLQPFSEKLVPQIKT